MSASPNEGAGKEETPPLMPVRGLHNFLYCPRLFYFQWVEGVFVPNEDTIMGSAVHSRIDSPDKLKNEALTADGGSLHSLALSSETLGITGVIDLLEKEANQPPYLVDYKKGYPMRGAAGEWQAKENDAAQLAAYALLLKESGVEIQRAGIYYAAIKKHVPVELTPELYRHCLDSIREAAALAVSGKCPAPLCDVRRCCECSLYPVCLPFETRYWLHPDIETSAPLRPPIPSGDQGEILIVQNPRARVGIHSGEIQVSLEQRVVARHPIHQLQAVYLYGAIQVSAHALMALMEQGISVSYFSPAGRFLGLAHGLPSSGPDARMGLYFMQHQPEKRLAIAAELIRAKIHNQRVLLMRNGHVSSDVLSRMAVMRNACKSQPSLSSLRGVEGAAAALYFENFSSMLKSQDSLFDFAARNRRPPKDPVNALLSMGYSMLAKELTGIAYTVGLDPFLGFFHSPRFGRPALALDMMEEFRPLIADSVVVSLINRGEVNGDDFIHTTRGCMMRDSARRQFWRAWTRRMDTEVSHAVFGYKMSYRRMMEVQMRQLWRFCSGAISEFYGFTTR